ncbi:MAG: alpha-2-macroglobulin family protein [Bdellovibrionaceae bacterium]|nr:alpha-2-macroglobulin family protein [Pseudobdellovibrionaceae bacterium]
MKRVLKFILSFFRAIFGKWRLALSWDKPAWLSKLCNKLTSSFLGRACANVKNKAQSSKLSQPRYLAFLGLGAMVLSGLLVAGYSAYQKYLESLPKPDYVGVSISAPQNTNPETKEIHGLRIHFSKSAAPMDQIGKEVTENAPTLSPALSGTWHWESDKSLVFTPQADLVAFQNDWLVGSTYTVSLNTKLFPSHLLFSKTKYEFNTAALFPRTTNSEFYIHPNNNKIRKALFTVTSSIPLDAEDFKKKVSLKISTKENALIGKGSQSLTPTISFNPELTQAYIESPALDMVGPDRQVELKLEKNLQSLRGGQGSTESLSASVDVPGKFSAFKVEKPQIIFARNEKFEPEQIITLETKVGVKSEDLLKSLKLYLLPETHDRVRQVQHGATVTAKDVREWYESDINSTALNNAEVLTPIAIPTPTPYSQTHSFKIIVPVDRYLYFSLSKGIKAMGDYELGKDVQHVVYSPNYTPELMFMSDGAILSLSGDGKLPLLARNVKQVEFEISRVLPEHINFLISRMVYNNSFTHPYHQDIEDFISERKVEKQNIPFHSETETQYFSLDLKSHKARSGFLYVRSKALQAGGVQKGRNSYYQLPSTERLILITDLGMIAKHTADQELYVYVQNLRTGQPMAQAKVDILGQNGIPVLTKMTDSQGHVVFPKFNFQREKKPLAIVARSGADVSYLPYQIPNRELAYSRFNTGGIHKPSQSEELSAMLFSDRGLYRPGETVNIGMILRSHLENTSEIEKLPLVVKVLDPRGNYIKQEKQKIPLFGLKDFHFTTQETSPTGTYVVQLYVTKTNNNYTYDQLISSTQVVLEEFQPDKLKIHTQLTPAKTVGWVPLTKLTARVSLKNLFGTAAENRMIKSELELIPTVPRTEKYRDYIFKYSREHLQTVKENLVDKTTDKNGEVEFDIDLEKYEGFYSVILRTQGYETGAGRSVEASASVFASTWKTIVGYKTDGSLNYIKRDSARSINLVALNSDLVPSAEDVTLQLHETQYVSALMKQNDGTYRYQSIKKEVLLNEDQKNIPASGLKLTLPTDKAGDFVYLVKNKEGQEINRIEFKVMGTTNLTRSLDRNAELQIVLNKEDYQPGEEIELQILAPYKGSGLITIERENVFAQKWFTTQSNTTIERIRIPNTVSGNAYVNVTFLRAIDSSEIYTSPLSYGVQPFSISLDKYKTQVNLQAPEKVKPGQALNIQYSASRPTSLILYGADEGILQVAKYTLPNPILHFFKKQALQVRTFQLLDLLLPEYSVLKNTSSPGGDDFNEALQRNLNPFKAKSLKPVVFWSGVLSASQKPQTFSYEVPDYFNGSIKIMAVASSKQGLGASETGSISRGDFIISPTTPVFVTPDDEIEVGVNVSNQSENPNASSSLTVKVVSSSHLSVSGASEQTLNVPVGREEGTSFKFKARREFGAANLKFEVHNGTESAKYSHELSVRPATPYITTIQAGIQDSLPLTIANPRVLAPELASQSLSLSFLPLSIGTALVQYLESFPYGCTEQIVSKAVPLLLTYAYDVGTERASTTHAHVISMLQRRQKTDGGFALYEGSGSSHTPATLYAITYLQEAQKHNLEVPEEMQEQLKEYLNSQDLRAFGNVHQVRMFTQSLYLRARYGENPKSDLVYLEQLLEKNFKGQWEQDVTAIYLAGLYQIIQNKNKGWDILKRVKMNEKISSNYEYYYDSAIRNGVYLRIIAQHFPERLASVLNHETWKSLLNPLLNGQYNTNSAAHILLAFSSLDNEKNKDGFPQGLKTEQTFQDGKTSELTLASGLVSKTQIDLGVTKLQLKGTAPTPLFYSLTQSGFDAELPTQEVKKRIEISRVVENQSGTPIKQVKMGDNIYIKVRWRTLKSEGVPHLVIVDLFPAGFELVSSSVNQNSASYVDYIDKREDRLVIYGYANAEMGQTTYELRATHRGKFNLPAIFGESLYDKSIQYRGVSETIEVL